MGEDERHTEAATEEGTARAVPSLARLYLRNADATYLVFAALMLGAWLFADLSVDHGWAWMAGNAVVIAVVAALSRPRSEPVPLRRATVQRILLAASVLPFCYFQSGPLIEQVRVEAVPRVEAWLLAWDLKLFGPGYHEWIVGLRVPWVTEILQILYACFYVLPLGLVLILLARGKAWSLPAVAFGIATGFLVSYVGYLLVPGRSPAFLDDSLVHDGGVWIATDVWNHVREAGRGAYDVFPSGHTALSLLVVYYAWRFDRVALAVLAPVAACVVISTVYMQYHYVLDIPAGVLLTVAIIVWDRRIQARAPAEPTLQADWNAG